MYKNQINKFNLKNKTVILRSDLNVPISNGKILDDFRLKESLKTIDLLLKKGAKILLITHIGRPEKIDSNLSTKNLLNWFKEKNYNIEYSDSIEDVKNKKSNIVLLENIRFFKAEKSQDLNFAEKLHNLAEFYVNDAFGTLHRKDLSVNTLAKLYTKDKKSIGLLVEKELNNLEKIKQDPKKPFLVIIGGSKLNEKIKPILNLSQNADKIFLAPAISFPFLKDKKYLNQIKDIDIKEVEKAKDKINKEIKNKIILPEDYVFENDKIISIGEKSIADLIKEIKKAKTIFLNGLFGFLNDKDSLEPFIEICKSIDPKKTFAVASGGDTSAAIKIARLKNRFSYLSTGGGSTLEFLANTKLPALDAILK